MPAVLALGFDPQFVDPERIAALGYEVESCLVLNVIHALAPGAKLCFNTNPADSAEAGQRWV